MNEVMVEREVRRYFTDRFPQFSVSQQCEVQFGTRHGIAAVVLHQLIQNGVGSFIAIAECKVFPLPILRSRARAQLKSYMSATNTRYGVLAVGTDPRNWEFCENKYNNFFVEIDRESFERGIENWMPVSVASLDVSLQRAQKTTRSWKRIAFTFGILFILTFLSLLLLWIYPPERDHPSETIVYITNTGSKYHASNCKYLRYSKIPISLEKAKQKYEPCSVCSPLFLENGDRYIPD